EGKVTVPADATEVNTSILTDIPEDYELVSTGDVAINGGWIWVEVRPVAEEPTTGTVTVEFVCDGEVVGTYNYTGEINEHDLVIFHTSALTAPTGYEIAEAGDCMGQDGDTIQVKVNEIVKEGTVTVEFVCDGEVVGKTSFTGEINKYDLIFFHTSALTAPTGYEIAEVGEFSGKDGETVQVKVNKLVQEGTVNIEFVCDGEVVGESSFTGEVNEYDLIVFNTSALTAPEGYAIAETGDCMGKDGETVQVKVNKIDTDDSVIMNIRFVLADGTFVAGGDYTVPAGVQNLSVLDQFAPAGYEIAETGDFYAAAGAKLVVRVEKVVEDVIMNIRFVTEDGTFLAGGDYFLPEGVQNRSILQKYVPAGYEMTEVGDFMVEEGGSLDVTVKATGEEITEVIMNIRFVTVDGEFVAGGDYFLPAGVQNYSVLEKYVPAGYQMTVAGDFFVEAGGSENVTVEKIPSDVIMNIQFVTADGEVIAGGDYFLPEGIQNYSILEQYVPEGYKMVEHGDFFVTAGGHDEVTIEKVDTTVIMNIRFVTVDGEFVAGGDYFLPEGIQNLSILEQYVPVGYKMMESGDFTVSEGGQEDITVEKIDTTVIVNIQFVTRDGEVVAGGDYFVTEGIQNRSVLDQYVPEGYRQTETGDINLIAGEHYEITIEKDIIIVNISFVDRYGNFIAGGDYFVPAGIVNRNVLDQYVSPGYVQAVTGDIEFIAGEHYDIVLDEDESIVNIQFVTRDGEVIAGGDYFVPTGIVNRSVLDELGYVPEGYRQAVTGDIQFIYGQHYEIIIEKIPAEVVTKTAIFRKGADDIWSENPDNPDEVTYTFFSDDPEATNIVPSITAGDETKALDYWVSDVDDSVILYPGDEFCYNSLDVGELEGYVGDFAFYPVYKDVEVDEPDEPTDPVDPVDPVDPEDPVDPDEPVVEPDDPTDDPVVDDDPADDNNNDDDDKVVKDDDKPADNDKKVIPKTGYGEVSPVVGIAAALLAAVIGAVAYLLVIRKKMYRPTHLSK
ncbi:MAG TPA: hypothetical protein IAC15_07900, partial [Candidatus Onthomonas avicola]|nr:hypothetical protein [Candidatus Onthomonas avicola]